MDFGAHFQAGIFQPLSASAEKNANVSGGKPLHLLCLFVVATIFLTKLTKSAPLGEWLSWQGCANFIAEKAKGLFSHENKPFVCPLVEISGIEPLTS